MGEEGSNEKNTLIYIHFGDYYIGSGLQFQWRE